MVFLGKLDEAKQSLKQNVLDIVKGVVKELTVETCDQKFGLDQSMFICQKNSNSYNISVISFH